jgi:hypothetical protein
LIGSNRHHSFRARSSPSLTLMLQVRPCSPCMAGMLWELFLEKFQRIMTLVFEGPVRSGFSTPKRDNRDRNWSELSLQMEGPQPNWLGPVLVGSVAPKKPV